MNIDLTNTIIYMIMFYLLWYRILFYRASKEATRFVNKFGREQFIKRYKSYDRFQDIMMYRRLFAALIMLGLTFFI